MLCSSPARRAALLSVSLLALASSLVANARAVDEAPAPATELKLEKIAALDTAVDPASSPTADVPVQISGVTVTAERVHPQVQTASAGQAQTTVDRAQFKDAPGQSISEMLALVPGVTFVNGNGPRDVSVSVRGSNNRQTYGVRNIKVFEDGFPVTQPDGMARTDLTDPHAYGQIDVVQGPSSAFYGNYATGGAIDFQLRQGRDIDGAEAAIDFGSNDYINLYGIAGNRSPAFEYTAFASQARGHTDTGHTDSTLTTANLLATYAATPRDRLTFKFINNDTDADLSIRLSLNQYRQNPYQQGCESTVGPGCASVSLFANGYNGSRQNTTAEQADLLRNDRRTIIGARWEHDLDSQTVLRTQAVFDNRDIKQPTSASASLGTYPSFNVSSDLLRGGTLFGLPSSAVAGVFYNVENINGTTYNVTPAGGATLGGVTQATSGTHGNLGLRLREELAFAPRWTGTVGVGAEFTKLSALATNYSYPVAATPTLSRINGKRQYYNLAPEYALRFAATEDLSLRSRVAGGYGTPQATNLFVTSQGTAGNNTNLSAQRNTGIDLGADWHYRNILATSVTGFYEFFRNELVTQSAGANLQSFTFNAPRSEHRGVEAGFDLHPLPALLTGAHVSAAYLYIDQIYTQYTERLTTGAQSAAFVRDHNQIPGVQPQYLNARLIYDQPRGALEGLGAYLEAQYRESFYLDNANLLKAPGQTLWNLNLHYDPPTARGIWSHVGAYLAIQNLFDETYVASASNITDTLNAATGAQNGADVLATSTGSIYAGTRRLFYAGIKARF